MAQSEPINSSKDSAEEKEKTFSRHRRWKEVFIFLVFLLLSFVFWTLQSLQEEYVITITFPISYKNIPSEMAFSSAVPHVIKAKIRDKGSILLNYTLGHSFAPINVIYQEKKKSKSGKLELSRQEIEGQILRQLIATTTLDSFDPSELSITYSPMQWKQIPVLFNGTIHTAAGHQVSDSVKIEPKSVQLYAPQQVLDSVSSIRTAYVAVENGSSTVVRNVKLLLVKGAKTDRKSVKVTIPIEEFTEKSVEIDVQCTNIPEHFRIRLFPSKVKVTCSIPLSRFKEVNENSFFATITLPELQDVSGTSLPVTLQKTPEWMHEVQIEPGKIDYLLEQQTTEEP